MDDISNDFGKIPSNNLTAGRILLIILFMIIITIIISYIFYFAYTKYNATYTNIQYANYYADYKNYNTPIYTL